MRFFTCPHPEHCLVEGKNRSTRIACPPTAGILAAKNPNNWPSPASAIARASLRFLNIPLTCRSSSPTTLHVRAISVVSWCWASCRMWASLPWKRASFTRAFSRFWLPCLVARSYAFRLNAREPLELPDLPGQRFLVFKPPAIAEDRCCGDADIDANHRMGIDHRDRGDFHLD